MTTKEKFSGYIVAVAAFLIMFMHQGAIGSIGVFLPHIASGNNLELGSVSLLVSYATISAAVVGIVIAPTLMKKITPKWLLFICSFVIPAHYILFSFGSQLWHYYLGGVIAGICMALGTTAAVTNIIGQWFITKRAAVLGLVIGGAGFGTAVFQAVGGALISAFDFRLAYQIMAIVICVVGVLANLFFIRTPDKVGQKALGWDTVDAGAGTSGGATAGVTLSETLRSPAFYLIFVGIVVGSMAWVGFKTYLASMLGNYGYSTVAASNYSTFMNAFAALMVMAGGMLAQKMGNKVYVTFLYVACIVGCVLIYVGGPSIGTVLLILAILFAACSNCSISSLPGTICTEAFGYKEYGRIVIYLMSASYLGQALPSFVVKGFLAAGWAWHNIYLFFGGCALVALVLCLLGWQMAPFRKMKKEMQQ